MLDPSQRRLVLRITSACALLFTLILAVEIRTVPRPRLYAGPLRFDALSAMAYTKALAEGHPDRITGTPSSRRAAQFLRHTFESLGYRVTLQHFRLWIYGSHVIGENVIATLPNRARSAPYVAVLAHYDHARTTHQAAEDDASGVGIVLELARATRGRIANPIFIATDAEETGMIGARNLVSYLKAHGNGAAIAVDYVNAGAAAGLQITASGQFGGYSPLRLRQIASEAAQQQSANVVFPYGLGEWIDRSIERSFQDQGPLLDAAIPAVNICSIPADVEAARLRYHTARDIYANFDPAAFAMVGRTAERAMQTVALGADMRSNDGLMLSPHLYVPYNALRWLLFLPLVPFIIAAMCYGLVKLNPRSLLLMLPALAAYAFVRVLAVCDIIPRFELYPAPPKDPLLYHVSTTAVFGIFAILAVGYAALFLRPLPVSSKGTLVFWTTVLAVAVFAIDPFALWFYLGPLLCASLLFMERKGGMSLAVNLSMLSVAVLPFAVIIWYFSREIYLGPYIWWYLVLQAAYGTWSVWVVGAATLATVLWTQYVRLAIAPFYASAPASRRSAPRLLLWIARSDRTRQSR